MGPKGGPWIRQAGALPGSGLSKREALKLRPWLVASKRENLEKRYLIQNGNYDGDLWRLQANPHPQAAQTRVAVLLLL